MNAINIVIGFSIYAFSRNTIQVNLTRMGITPTIDY